MSEQARCVKELCLDELRLARASICLLDSQGFFAVDKEGGQFLGAQICEAAGVPNAKELLKFVSAKKNSLNLETEYASVYRRLISLSEASPHEIGADVIHKALDSAATVLSHIAHVRTMRGFVDGGLTKE